MQTFTCNNCGGQYEAETQADAEAVGWHFSESATLCPACELIRLMSL